MFTSVPLDTFQGKRIIAKPFIALYEWDKKWTNKYKGGRFTMTALTFLPKKN